VSNDSNKSKKPKVTTDELTKIVNESVMGVLAALYETKIVKKVSIRNVMILFGTKENLNEFNDDYINFDSKEFQHNYKVYKKKQLQEIMNKIIDLL